MKCGVEKKSEGKEEDKDEKYKEDKGEDEDKHNVEGDSKTVFHPVTAGVGS